MAQEKQFTCVIEDLHLKDRFSATVKVTKKTPIEAAEQKDRIGLAHIYITPVSDQVRKVHHHFVLFDFTGCGVYIVRDRYGKRDDRRQCSIWDLGHSFAIQVMDALREIA